MTKIKFAALTAVFLALFFTVSGCKENVDLHTHTFNKDWSYDEDFHWHKATCEHTDEVSAESHHKYGEWNAGKNTCTVCGYEKTCNHMFGDWIVSKAATKEEEGSKERYCPICGIKQTVVIAKINHVHVLGTKHDAVPATCTKEGTIEYYDCKDENCSVKFDKDGWEVYSILTAADPVNGHSFNEHYVCECGKIKELTVSEFISALGDKVETITANSSVPGITKSEDGKTVNVWEIKTYGSFSRSKCFPSTIKIANLQGLITSNVTSMNCMFYGCSKLTNLDVTNFDTSKVTDMSFMFNECSNLTSLDITNFDTSNVTNMLAMFLECGGLTTLDVSKFNTSMVTDMVCMFSNCSNLTSLDITNFDTSNVTNMKGMFQECSGLTSLDLSKFNTSNVTDMSFMFSSCIGLTTLDLSSFDTSKVTDVEYMFQEFSDITITYNPSTWTLGTESTLGEGNNLSFVAAE